ncbi:hypothetical protein [Pseudomonas rubra]|uniref:Uncharacterized protein n=1 Tax=Pseudomonas rubra TaxID=2942627 RepID=A0ABT5PG14_9PSED|nr:hypothetical protein [Pseudomonas rubra]MDD1017136.1 hypothetical protein [Pseudomonas rubra]MDD1040743.1 hypothetical protein [Pseudomonas rubra]MDD1154831.1 hypothetical protein [Pseudomonas rubra]
MDINLLNESMLGHWRVPSGVWQCEFQFGSQLIYVQHHNDEPPCARLAAAQCAVKAAWDDLPQALKFAEQRCKAQMPELIRLYETYMPWESPLFVYSIHFDLDKPYPSYAISKNPDFDWDHILIDVDELCQNHSVCMEQYEPKDDFWVYVRRVGFKQFELGD